MRRQLQPNQNEKNLAQPTSGVGYVRPSVYTTPRGPDPRVQQITKNLLARMRQCSVH
jgi:hypothetical protein